MKWSHYASETCYHVHLCIEACAHSYVVFARTLLREISWLWAALRYEMGANRCTDSLRGGGGVRTVGRKADQFHSVKWPVSSFLFFKKSGVINFWKQHDFTVIKATSISILVCVNSRFAKLCVYTFVLNRYYTKWFSEHRIEIRETQQAQYMKRPTLLRLVRYFSVASLYYCSVGWGAISLPTMSTALQFGLI